MNRKRTGIIIKAILSIALVAWCSLFLARKINLTDSDIGRHLKNGQLLTAGDRQVQREIMYENFYSYTNPDYPFVNHHWGAGLLFYFIWTIFGFKGLSIFYIICCLTGFLIVFLIAWRESSFWLSYSVSILAAPLIGLRNEIRPEMATYLFCPIVFWVLWNYRKGRINYYWLFAIVPIMAIWINFNLYFIFGIYLIGLFWFDSLLKLRKAKIAKNQIQKQLTSEKLSMFSLLGISTLIALMLNPWGIKGILYPFVINSQIQMSVFELTSPFVLKQEGSLPFGFESYFILLGVICVLMVLLAFKNFRRRFSFVVFVWSLTLVALSVMQARNIALFALFSIPLIAIMGNVVIKLALSHFKMESRFLQMKLNDTKIQKIATGALIIFLFSLSSAHNVYFLTEKGVERGLGLRDDNLKTLECFKENGLQGPIYNDFDISSYLIFGLYPREKVFVDHRPEAYPPAFFEDYLHKPLTDEHSWNMISQQYQIETIVLTNKPNYSAIQLFVNRRIKDPNWDLLCKDEKALVLKRRL